MLRTVLPRAHGGLVHIDSYLHTLILVHLALALIVNLTIDLKNLGPAFSSVSAEGDTVSA